MSNQELISRRLIEWDNPAIIALLKLTVGNPTPERLDKIRAWCAAAPDREIETLFLGEQLIGLVGTEPLDDKTIEICHIAIAANLQGNGYGRRLIEDFSERHPGRTLLATTDVDAVEFYRRCGFTIRTLGENTYGRERFDCRR